RFVRALLLSLVAVLSAAHAAPAAQDALDPEFRLIRQVAAGAPVDTDPAALHRAFEEVLADAVISRLYGTPPLVENEDTVLATLGTDPASRALVEKLP